MIDFLAMSAEEIAEVQRLEAAANETFGEDSLPVRTTIGLMIGWLANRAGLPATRAYVENTLKLCRRIDPEDPAPLPPASSQPS